MAHVLVVDDEPAIVETLKLGLERVDHKVSTATTAKHAVRRIGAEQLDVVILDIKLPDGNGLDILRRVRQVDDQLPVIFITGLDDSGTAIEAMKRGALDYLVKPLDLKAIRSIVNRAAEIRTLTQKQVAMNPESGRDSEQAIIGQCEAMQDVYKAIGIVANQNVTVLVRGESGTGKELVARALYQYGERTKGPFLAVNCAAIPENLLESELFGHERGAFTGADRKRIGKFEQCHGGTLFLDEIGDMSPFLQSKLLRVLQDQQFERIGGNETIKTDVRLVAATNRNLEEMVANREFRDDLYYRLNGFTVHLPPLRERGDDLELLVEHFRRVSNRELGKNVKGIAPEAIELLKFYTWPGNIRELQNAIRQAILKTTGQIMLPDFLPDFVKQSPESQISQSKSGPNSELDNLIANKLRAGAENLYDEVIGHVEDRLVQLVLANSDGNKHAAAKRLGVNPTVLRSTAALELLELNTAEKINGHSAVIRPGMTMEEIEREAIRQALVESNGARKIAAESLGISVRTMQRKIKEHNLEV